LEGKKETKAGKEELKSNIHLAHTKGSSEEKQQQLELGFRLWTVLIAGQCGLLWRTGCP